MCLTMKYKLSKVFAKSALYCCISNFKLCSMVENSIAVKPGFHMVVNMS